MLNRFRAGLLLVFVGMSCVAIAQPATVRSPQQALRLLDRYCAPSGGRVGTECQQRQNDAQRYLEENLSPAELHRQFLHGSPWLVIAALQVCAETDACLQDADIEQAQRHRSGYVRAQALALMHQRWSAARQRDVLYRALGDAAAASPDNVESVADRAFGQLQWGDALGKPARGSDGEVIVPDLPAQLEAIRRDHAHEAARNTTLRSVFFAAARRHAPARLSLDGAAQQLAAAGLRNTGPALQPVRGKAALARILQSNDVVGLIRLTQDPTPLVRAAALDALAPRVEPIALVDPVLRLIADDTEWTMPEGGGCVTFGTIGDDGKFEPDIPTIDAIAVAVETVLHYLDAAAAQDLYRRGSTELQQGLLSSAREDAHLRLALVEPLRAAAVSGDPHALEQLGQLGERNDADLQLILSQLPAHPEAAFKALRGDTRPAAIEALVRWWEQHAATPCTYYEECAPEPGSRGPTGGAFENLASLGEAAQPLIDRVFTTPMARAHRRFHIQALLRSADETQLLQLEQQRQLIRHERLRALKTSDPAAAIALARRALQNLDAIQSMAPHKTNARYIAGNANASTADRLISDESGLGPMLQQAIWILAEARAPDLDDLLLAGLQSSAACCVEPFARSVAMKRLPAGPALLLARFEHAEEEFALVALADAIAAYVDPALDQALRERWAAKSARHRPVVDTAVRQALEERKLLRQFFPGVR